MQGVWAQVNAAQSPEPRVRGRWAECPRRAPDLSLVSQGSIKSPPHFLPKAAVNPSLPFQSLPLAALAEPRVRTNGRLQPMGQSWGL